MRDQRGHDGIRCLPSGSLALLHVFGDGGRSIGIMGLVLAILISSIVIGTAGQATGNKLEFNRDIRPILSDNCFKCHGPDKNNRKAKLRLDVREVALEKEAFKPGKPDESELVRRIFTTKADDQMPPPDSNKHLTAGQKDILKRWIAEGAEYQPHWAYIKIERPQVPATKNQAWVNNSIDSFVLHELEARSIPPSIEADKRTLLRRLSLDLIGLPPTPEEVEAFLKDSRPGAYERQVDRLLSSPHYGERMAVSWLDLARFADTVGYHGDQNVNVFPYRDYVIDAYNRNKPFDQFTIEQLAGDLLPHPTKEQLVATGFNRMNMMTREGGAQAKEYLAKYGADRVRTIATTWLGSTMGCCECHDHKFDPFSTKDFYSMKAFFADVKQWGVYMDYGYTPNPDLKGFGNDHPFPPEITVESPYLKQRLERIEKSMEGLEAASAAVLKSDRKQQKAYGEWRSWSKGFLKKNPSGWLTLRPTGEEASTNAEKNFTVNADGSALFSEKSKENAEIKLPLTAGWISAIRLELLPRAEHGGTILIGKAKDDTTMVKLTAKLKSKVKGKDKTISFYYAEADHKEDRYVGGAVAIGVKDGWKTAVKFEKSPQTAVYLLDEPIRATNGEALTVQLGKSAVGCARISISPFAAKEPLKAGGGKELQKKLSKWFHKYTPLLSETYLLSASPDNSAFSEYKKLHLEALECRGGESPTVVTVPMKPMVTRVLGRGNWQDDTGEIVTPATPHFLPQTPNPEGRRLTRLDLAKWLVSRDNPLTARAVMNRTWKQFFGSGISAVVDDLGAQGEWPTHPELLNWLAVEFMDSGWDTKHMIKLMVMSSTYRQSSNPSPRMHEQDPANKLLASQSPRRLDAEFVRDNALTIAGLLNEDMGGPSVFPYQPAGYYANIQFPDREYYPDQDDRQYRRGVYVHWQRTFLQPMLANFDAPAREECTAIRNVSNSPQQALTLLNDPTFVEAARMLAGNVLSAAPAKDDNRLDLIYEKALARPVKRTERTSLERFLKVQREYYQAHPDDAKKVLHVGLGVEPRSAGESELAAWTQVCRVVLGLHETITRY